MITTISFVISSPHTVTGCQSTGKINFIYKDSRSGKNIIHRSPWYNLDEGTEKMTTQRTEGK